MCILLPLMVAFHICHLSFHGIGDVLILDWNEKKLFTPELNLFRIINEDESQG